MVVLAVVSALLYGSGDFCGAMATRRSTAVAVALWSQLAGVVVLVVVLPFLPASTVSAADLLWGVAAGFAGGVGMVLLYKGLSSGAMAVVAPVTAVCAAVVPVVGGALLGEAIGGLGLAGIVLGLGAVLLLSLAPAQVPEGVPVTAIGEAAFPQGAVSAPHPRAAVLMGVAAGCGFGLFFLALDQTDDGAGLWPLLGARASSLSTLVVLGLVGGGGFAVARSVRSLVVGAGVLDMGANVAFLLATQRGAVGLVAVLVALAPAATVLLARLVLHEHLSVLQLLGLGVAAVSVVLIALR